MSICPECREPYPKKAKRHRYAEKAAEELAGLMEERAQFTDWNIERSPRLINHTYLQFVLEYVLLKAVWNKFRLPSNGVLQMQHVEVFLKTMGIGQAQIGIQGSEKAWIPGNRWRPEANIFWESTQDGPLFAEAR